MSRASDRYWAAYDRKADRDLQQEEEHFDQHGFYTKCAAPGCDNECNPSNVHASGKKYCDECWEKSDDE